MPAVNNNNGPASTSGPVVEYATTAYHHTQASHAKLRPKADPAPVTDESPRQLTDWVNHTQESSRLRCRDALVDAPASPAGCGSAARPMRLKISKVAQVIMRGHGNLLTGCEPPATPGGAHEASTTANAQGDVLSPRTLSALRDRRSQEAKAAAAFLAAAKRKLTIDTVDGPHRDPAVPSMQHHQPATACDEAGVPAGAGRPIVSETPSRRRMSPHDPVRSSTRASAKGPVPDTVGREHDWWASSRAKTPRADREAVIVKEREARRHPSADRYHSVGRVGNAPSQQNVVTGRVLGTSTEATAALPVSSTGRTGRRHGTPPQPLGRRAADNGAHHQQQAVRARGRSPASEKNRSSAGAAAALTWNTDTVQRRPATPTAARRRSHTSDVASPCQETPAGTPNRDIDCTSVRSGYSRASRAATSTTTTAASRHTSRSVGASRWSPVLGSSRDRVVEWTRGTGSPFAVTDGQQQQRQPHGRRGYHQQQSTKDNLRWW